MLSSQAQPLTDTAFPLNWERCLLGNRWEDWLSNLQQSDRDIQDPDELIAAQSMILLPYDARLKICRAVARSEWRMVDIEKADAWWRGIAHHTSIKEADELWQSWLLGMAAARHLWAENRFEQRMRQLWFRAPWFLQPQPIEWVRGWIEKGEIQSIQGVLDAWWRYAPTSILDPEGAIDLMNGWPSRVNFPFSHETRRLLEQRFEERQLLLSVQQHLSIAPVDTDEKSGKGERGKRGRLV